MSGLGSDFSVRLLFEGGLCYDLLTEVACSRSSVLSR